MAGRIYRASLLRSDSVKSLAQLFLRIWQPSHWSGSDSFLGHRGRLVSVQDRLHRLAAVPEEFIPNAAPAIWSTRQFDRSVGHDEARKPWARRSVSHRATENAWADRLLFCLWALVRAKYDRPSQVEKSWIGCRERL